MNAVTRIEQPSAPAEIENNNPYSLIRHAMASGVSVEVMERLSALCERWEAAKAKREFDEAMAKFQSLCPQIEKSKSVLNKDGRTVRYKYAPLDSVVAQVKGLLQECGFSYTIEADVDIASKSVKAVCKVTHCAGHSSQSSFAVPIDPEGYMNAPQKFASALTFAKRYAFTNVFGILTSDEDTDTNTVKEKPTPNAMHGDKAPTRTEIEGKRLLVDATRRVHLNASGHRLSQDEQDRLTQWLVDEALIADTETVANLSGDRLNKAIERARVQFA